jgi:hypothetical protein
MSLGSYSFVQNRLGSHAMAMEIFERHLPGKISVFTEGLGFSSKILGANVAFKH